MNDAVGRGQPGRHFPRARRASAITHARHGRDELVMEGAMALHQDHCAENL